MRARAVADALRAVNVAGTLVLLAAGHAGDAAGLAAVAVICVAVRFARAASGLDLLFVAAVTASAWATQAGLYDEVDHEQRSSHLLLPALVTPLLVVGARRAGVLVARIPPTVAGALAFLLVAGALGTALGALYELCEWAADATLGTDMSLGYDDTVGDLICDTAGSYAAAGVLSWREWRARGR